MDLLSFFLLIIIININFSQGNNIIQIPIGTGNFENISTKYGYINYSFYKNYIPTYRWLLPNVKYILKGIKNLSLMNFKDERHCLFEIFGLNKDNLNLTFEGSEFDEYNNLLCKLFYKTNYIDKMIYSIGMNEKNELYKFYGGIPENLTKNLNKITFNNKTDKLSKISFELNNGTNYTLNIKKDYLFKIDDTIDFLFCLPFNIFNTFKELFVNETLDIFYQSDAIYQRNYIYYLNKTEKDLFPKSISFKIGNKNIILKKNQMISSDFILKNSSFFLLLISSKDCYDNNIFFGKKFLEYFNFYEEDLESGEYNLYLNKSNENIIKEEERQNIILNSHSKNQINIIIFIFTACTFTLFLFRQYQRNKANESFNYYFEI